MLLKSILLCQNMLSYILPCYNNSKFQAIQIIRFPRSFWINGINQILLWIDCVIWNCDTENVRFFKKKIRLKQIIQLVQVLSALVKLSLQHVYCLLKHSTKKTSHIWVIGVVLVNVFFLPWWHFNRSTFTFHQIVPFSANSIYWVLFLCFFEWH